MMPSTTLVPSGTPIFDAIRTLDGQHTNTFYQPGSSDSMVWLMEPGTWHELQREMCMSNYTYVAPADVTMLGWSVVTVPKMSGITLHDSERGFSFNLADLTPGQGQFGMQQILGHVDWLHLIKQGARAVA